MVKMKALKLLETLKEKLVNFWHWYRKCLDKHYHLTIFITSLPFVAIIQLYIELCLKR